MRATLKCVKTQKRNVTIALPTELVREAKAIAAKRGVSLNAWIYENLDRAVRFGDNYIAAGEKLLNASKEGLYRVPKGKWSRDELYRV
jgi:hypothetical protein